MKKKIQGTFEVKSTPQPMDPLHEQLGVMRMRFEKKFSGPLDATGLVSMIGIMNKDLGSGGYVAIERITGSVDGRAGSFCMQHSSTMTRGKPAQSITVIPDSGTDELRGLTGQLVVDIVGGVHSYTFHYELTAAD